MTMTTDGGELAAAVAPVREWATHASGLDTVQNFPAEAGGPLAVLLYPLGLRVDQGGGAPTATIDRAALTIDLLVTCVGGTPLDAAAATCGLALSAVAAGTYAVDPDGPGLEAWTAIGRAPAPAFLLQLPVRREISRPGPQLVREPLRVTYVTRRTVEGRVVVDDGTPLSNARVVLLPGGPETRSDHRGRFALQAPVGDDVTLRIHLSARGRSATISVASPASADLGDLTLHLPELADSPT